VLSQLLLLPPDLIPIGLLVLLGNFGPEIGAVTGLGGALIAATPA